MAKIPQEEIGEVALLTNLIHSLAIIQEGYIKEIERILVDHGRFKYKFKQHVKTITQKTIEMRSEIYHANADTADRYGELSDKIEEGIKEIMDDVKKQLS